MNENNTCKKCVYFNVAQRTENSDAPYPVFQCRRYAPKWISGVGTGCEKELFALISPDDWCGEFEEEEK